MRIAVVVVALLWVATARGDAPTGYQCGPNGKSVAGVGCACKAGFVAARDAADAAICKPAPPAPIARSRDVTWTKHLAPICAGTPFVVTAVNDDALIAFATSDSDTALIRMSSGGNERWHATVSTPEATLASAPVFVGGKLWLLWNHAGTVTLAAFSDDGKELERLSGVTGAKVQVVLDRDAAGPVVLGLGGDTLHVGRPSGNRLTWTDAPLKLGELVAARLLSDGQIAIAAGARLTSTTVTRVRVDGAASTSITAPLRKDRVQDMLVGPKGEVTIRFWTGDASHRDEDQLRGYDGSGALAWRHATDHGSAASIHPSGDIFIFDGRDDVVRIRSDGTPIARATIATKAAMQALAPTSYGEVYILATGELLEPCCARSRLDLVYAKPRPIPSEKLAVAPGKGERWHDEISGVTLLAVDRAGETFLASDGYPNQLRKLDRDGRLAWSREIDLERVLRIVATPAGEGIATGWDRYGHPAIVKFASDGRTLWENAFDPGRGTVRSDGVGAGSHLGDDGSIFVVGDQAQDPDRTERWILKLAPDGTKLWDMHVGVDGYGAVSDGSDGVIVGGIGAARIDGSGKVAWTWMPTEPPADILHATLIARPHGGAFAVLTLALEVSQRVRVYELDPAGKVVATHDHAPTQDKRVGGHLAANAGYVDRNGALIVAGSGTSKGGKGWIMKLDPGGTQAWVRTYANPVLAIATDGNENVHILTPLAKAMGVISLAP